ncbi:hypothetical protein [Nonomuraea turkmeniaca]|nr:hypothetical protein [Nonomuraea turkmeniaca]
MIAETLTTAWRRLNDVLAGDGARLWLYAAVHSTNLARPWSW